MRMCRDCEHWRITAQWRGTCSLHLWEKPKWSEDASVPNCPDYVDKYAKYQVAQEVK